jgi:putative endonuclease
MGGYVYILKSLKNGIFYVGSTNDLKRRVKEHNLGKSKFVRFNKPFELVFSQFYDDLEIARKVEFKLKSFKSREILEKIVKDGYCSLEFN